MLFNINIFNSLYIKSADYDIVILAALAEISITSIANGFTNEMAKMQGIKSIDELRKIRWIVGISFLPGWCMPLVAAMGGFFEEIVFRGVFMQVMIDQYNIALWVTIILSTVLFVYHQIIQLDTPTQKFIIGISSCIISIIGGLTVVYTGSILPAVFAHTSFVIFYTSGSGMFFQTSHNTKRRYRM
jgi:membrane protease YdiL (CAAX protease family)